MKRIVVTLTTIIGFFLSCEKSQAPQPVGIEPVVKKTLLYEGVWGTIYHAEVRQCDNTPTITGSGFKIDPENASEMRIIAISQEMLYDMNRRAMIDTTTDNRFDGKIAYGDTVWIESPRDSLGRYTFPNLNGYWVVHDTKNKRYEMSIDFLQTKHDSKLYNDDPLWCGKFNGLNIYSLNT